jgi:hypothetical protein
MLGGGNTKTVLIHIYKFTNNPIYNDYLTNLHYMVSPIVFRLQARLYPLQRAQTVPILDSMLRTQAQGTN